MNEPGPDWVPLAVAPFYYFGGGGFIRTQGGGGFIRTKEEWKHRLIDLRRRFDFHWDAVQDRFAVKPDWRWSSRTGEIQGGLYHVVFIRACGLTLCFTTDSAEVNFGRSLKFGTCEDDDLSKWVEAIARCPDVAEDVVQTFVTGKPDEFLTSEAWRELDDDNSRCFKFLASQIFAYMADDFSEAVRTGKARIAARKNSVLAPFEWIKNDQWTYFRVDGNVPIKKGTWADAVSELIPVAPPSSATGPNGEKLFAIYVAPGPNVERNSQEEPYTACARYLFEQMKLWPEHPPAGTVPAMKIECLQKFPGLSGNGFDRAYQAALSRTGAKWSQAGRKPKISAEMSAVNGLGTGIAGAKHGKGRKLGTSHVR